MLTDSPPDLDRRVLDALHRQGQPPLLVIPRCASTGWRFASLLFALVWLPLLLLRFGRPIARMGGRMRGGYGSLRSGMRAFVELQAASLAFFWSRRDTLRGTDLLYAHDQMAGLTAWLVCRVYGVPYIYDAHEIVPFRARRTGLGRMLLEYGWERAIVGASRRCVVVNRPMQRFYRCLYGTATYEVRENDFFPERAVPLDPAGRRLVVYIGAIGQHRGLERMVDLAASQGAEVLCFCSGDNPGAIGLSGAEVHGLVNYEPLLLRRVAGAAPYLWCGFDNDVLSYSYALPNKFFQAMALGIPIIATPGSYLGRLATRHGLGIVLDAKADPWLPGTYSRCVRSMVAFRAAYRVGALSI